MDVTEEEARRHDCCGPENCGYEKNGCRFCTGSRCMAWQWVDAEYEYARSPKSQHSTFFGINQEPPEGDEWECCNTRGVNCQYRKPMGDKRRGQCGLANFDVVVET